MAAIIFTWVKAIAQYVLLVSILFALVCSVVGILLVPCIMSLPEQEPKIPVQ